MTPRVNIFFVVSIGIVPSVKSKRICFEKMLIVPVPVLELSPDITYFSSSTENWNNTRGRVSLVGQSIGGDYIEYNSDIHFDSRAYISLELFNP